MSGLFGVSVPAGGLKAGIAVVTAGAVVAVVTLTASGINQAKAADGDPLLVGQSNWSPQTTYLNWHRRLSPQPDTGLAVLGEVHGAIFATNEEYVHGDPSWIDGIRAFGNDRGGYLYGVNYGVVASSEDIGVSTSAGETGLEATGDTGVEAVGRNVALTAEGPMSIQAQGAVSFSSAGTVTIPLGASSSAAVTPGTDVMDSSMVLATAQTPGGQVLRVARNIGTDTIRIHLTAPATQAVTVAYFVIG